MTETKSKVLIYTDGACKGNPGPGGYGTILLFNEKKKEISGGEPHTTNNRMELMAVIEGLQALKRPCEVTLYSDSKYLVDMVEGGYLNRWKKNNWMRNKKDPVKNVDLWEKIFQLLQVHDVKMIWVKGHAENPWNNRCDELAVAAAAKFQQ
ncbi:ribonuclease HI [Flexilinea flocculi]|jgi:ribonuclease HI|uniref:Ribonuclease H n=1 Tax=Flexilinea flocculi TaxID=1678840 RepID=A0A0K8PAS4_9CHLR|nr:ribonuclease HI [Flexilinea flocculi]NMB94770.1 ribonuclease HI [Flexilinea flocculi]GAP39757.1 ribonuclease HI [Flexilinea flocculi]